MVQNINASTVWNMDFHLLWKMSWQAPDSTKMWDKFLFLVMIVSIFLHLFCAGTGLLGSPVWASSDGSNRVRCSFELIQWAGRTDSRLADILSKPGLAMQKLTTKEPTADMAEVAIAAVEAVFDWREYLKEEFGWKPEENEEKNADI